MAVVTLYFGASSAGANDGSSWANRMELNPSSIWNTEITGFDFTSDSLLVYIGPGTYTVNTLQTFTVAAPSLNHPLDLKACDSNGDPWVPPDPDWCSAQPLWDTTGMPVIQTVSNATVINHAGVNIYGLVCQSATRTGGSILAVSKVNWCYGLNSASNSNVLVLSAAILIDNCVFECSGTAYSAICNLSQSIPPWENVRFVGNLAASSGTRYGWQNGSNGTQVLSRCTSINNVGGGFIQTSAGVNARLMLDRCVSADNEGDGVATSGTSASLHFIRNCFVTGASLTNGINISGTGKSHIAETRIRGATTSIVGSLEYCDIPYWDNTDDAGTDADEYVDAGAGDYRIKNTSSYWGKGIGAGDEPATGGGGDYTYEQVKQIRYKMRQGAVS